ncbi:SIS domain-containing protein [Actinopolymorpha sp. B17G11]|uniref:SIS domain-containing protein n=1 Tax=Actinopolymorpha sp. B17G11 TaxID=3160861 RepID=UPI0032E4F376
MNAERTGGAHAEAVVRDARQEDAARTDGGRLDRGAAGDGPSGARIDDDAAVRVLRTAIDRVVNTQREPIAAVADLIADAIPAGGIVQVFGTGHSRAFAMEIAGRAGGLVPANMLAVKDLVFRGGEDPAAILDPLVERDPALAARILPLHDLHPRDVFLVVSSSGGNGSTVEMARLAKERGHPVVAVTSLEHSRGITSRHPSGLRLFEVADVVIDNCSAYGDAELAIPGASLTICPTSSVTGAVIAQMITTQVCARLLAAGHEVPVYVSANVPEGDAHNERMEARYGTRVTHSEP